LSNRDASGQIPINFITHPGVHLTKACFSAGIYDDLPTQQCISDLLATQIRRLVVDLYWDNINQQFNLCPVELPPLAGNATAGYSVDTSALFTITESTVSSTTFSTPITAAPNGTNPSGVAAGKRQASVSAASTSAPVAGNLTSVNATATATTTTTGPSSTSSDEAIPTSTGVSGGTLLNLGPYTCSLDLNLGSIISLYQDYFSTTADTISARLQFLEFNLHAAAPFTDPSAPAQRPMLNRLPSGGDLIGAQFISVLDKAVYTPQALRDDRQNLNQSWYRDEYRTPTDDNYFSVFQLPDGNVATHDGWPGESWALLTDNRRLLLAWGTIDPQMSLYDFQADSLNVFNDSLLVTTQRTTWGSNGILDEGCYFKQDETTVAQTNASWAVSTIEDLDIPALANLAQNLTACGISPVLNRTFGGSSVAQNLVDYQGFVEAAVYGWAPGEPSNASSEAKEKHTGNDFRCAMLDANAPPSGRWRVDVCQTSRRAACRIAGQPYAWRLTTEMVTFDVAPGACPEHTTFDLPRTGLENTYLYREILNTTSTLRNDEASDILEGVWINFNSLDQPGCWVIGGPNMTCSYSNFAEKQQQRNVLIPTIAALIILVLSVLTLLVKCNQNRRSNTRRRRGENGWEYEGIPS
jgi:hypothetical protein